MESFGAARKENMRHQWQQERHPPQMRHEKWLARGDTVLPPSERAKIYDTHTGQARDIGNRIQRPDAVCRSKFSTQRAPGKLATASESLSKQLDIPRHAWLKKSHQPHQTRRFIRPPTDIVDDKHVNGINISTSPSLLDLPRKPLEHLIPFLSLTSFGNVEATSKKWNLVLHASVTYLLKEIPQRTNKVLEVKCRGQFQPQDNKKLAPVSQYESIARAYRFALLCEQRLDQSRLGHSCLSQGSSAKHSLVVSATKLDSSGLAGSRILQSFGWGNFGQTGLRCFQPQAVPALVEPFATEQPRRITMASAGTTHSLCCDEAGVVWSWGEDDTLFGGGRSSGYGSGSSELCRHADPRPVASLRSVRVLSVAAGNRFSLCLADDGKVWSWGANSWGCLGQGERRDEPAPRPILKFENKAVGRNDESSCDSSSSNTFSQKTDHNSHKEAINTTSSAPYFIAISAGLRHCLALDSKGHVWSWGCGSDGALGLGDRENRTMPTKCHIITSKAEENCQAMHDYQTTQFSTGSSYTPRTSPPKNYGQNQYNRHFSANSHSSTAAYQPHQLSHHRTTSQEGTVSKYPYRSSPNLDNSPPLSHHQLKQDNHEELGVVMSVSAGTRHSLLITKDGRLMSCGSNDHGQLGRACIQTKTGSSGHFKDHYATSKQPCTGVSPSALSQSFKHKNNQNYSQHQYFGTIQKPQTMPSTTLQGSMNENNTSPVDSSCIDDVFRPIESDTVSSLAGSLQRSMNFITNTSENNSQVHGSTTKHANASDSAEGGEGSPNDWIVCSAGGSHSLALKRDGSAWSWGSDIFGQLGLGNTSPPPLGFGSNYEVGSARPIRTPFTSTKSTTTATLAGSRVSHQTKPCRISSLKGQVIETIAAGDNHSLFKVKNKSGNSRMNYYSSNSGIKNSIHSNHNYNDDGSEDPIVVLACGDGSQGQLGTLHEFLSSGDIADHAVPTYVDLIRERIDRSPYSHKASQSHAPSLRIGNFAKPGDGTRLRYG